MKKTTIVNLLGGPGSGKSTTRAGVFHRLKLSGVNAEELTEYAKDLTWEERKITLLCQPYVFGKQLRNQERLLGKVDVIISDSPLILSAYYGMKYSTVMYPDTFYDFVAEMAKFDYANSVQHINVMLDRVKPYNPKGRNQSEEEARVIDSELRDLLNRHNFIYYSMPGDENAADKITKIVLDKIGR